MIEKTPHKITLLPFKTDFIKDTKVSLLVIVVGGIAGLFLENPQYKGIAWGLAIIGVGFMLKHWIFSNQVEVIFDLNNKTIYRKNILGNKKMLSFSEGTLLCESNNYGSQSYHLAHKKNRYKSLQRISSYLSEKEVLEFEQKIISEIAPLLDNPNISELNQQQGYAKIG